jgi:hypothetical protein
MKDQTVKVAEALEVEAELRRLREENVDLRRRVTEFSSIETSKKKLESRVEQLELKVYPEHLLAFHTYLLLDGRNDSRQSVPERERAECHV